MDIKVLSRKEIYVDGKKIKRKRLDFDGYVLHCRDVFQYKDIVIKIDMYDLGKTNPKLYYQSNTEKQCKLELALWKKLKLPERKFFAQPIASGYFYEYINEKKYKVYWLAQNKYYRSKKKCENHPEFDELMEILRKYYLEDVGYDDRNCFVDIEDTLVCVDYAI